MSPEVRTMTVHVGSVGSYLGFSPISGFGFMYMPWVEKARRVLHGKFVYSEGLWHLRELYLSIRNFRDILIHLPGNKHFFQYWIFANLVIYFVCLSSARFSPDDKYSKQRVRIKKRFGLLPTQQPAPVYWGNLPYLRSASKPTHPSTWHQSSVESNIGGIESNISASRSESFISNYEQLYLWTVHSSFVTIRHMQVYFFNRSCIVIC